MPGVLVTCLRKGGLVETSTPVSFKEAIIRSVIGLSRSDAVFKYETVRVNDLSPEKTRTNLTRYPPGLYREGRL